jgi:hypothetical protein
MCMLISDGDDHFIGDGCDERIPVVEVVEVTRPHHDAGVLLILDVLRLDLDGGRRVVPNPLVSDRAVHSFRLVVEAFGGGGRRVDKVLDFVPVVTLSGRGQRGSRSAFAHFTRGVIRKTASTAVHELNN